MTPEHQMHADLERRRGQLAAQRAAIAAADIVKAEIVEE
jgi:hypothetical protein